MQRNTGTNQDTPIKKSNHPANKLTIIGGGIIGALEAYYAYLDAKKSGTQIRITINEKNQNITETTTSNIVPSLTPDEILAVVPRGQALIEKLKIPFSQPGGIRVDDVKGVNDSKSGEKFKKEVLQSSLDITGHDQRTDTLMKLGKMSMDAWQRFYDDADAELKKILEASNFNSCREPKKADKTVLHDGYRIDLLYDIPNAKGRAEEWKSSYEKLGYKHCKILSPSEVMVMDSSLIDFCKSHSDAKDAKKIEDREWKNDTVALYRPGGCIDTRIFLPQFYDYLTKKMGTYVNEKGIVKNCFRIKYARNVKGVVYDEKQSKTEIVGLKLLNKIKTNKHTYSKSDYIFAPGEAVGTLESFGFKEPAFARFAGASLILDIPFDPAKFSADQLKRIREFNHCMEVHQEGICLAWQGRVIGNKIFIGVAGTKAFYADQAPDKNQEFARNRNLLQLNMINDVLPEFIGIALGKETKGQKLTAADLETLEKSGIAKRWVGTRAVAYDGFPTVGALYNASGQVSNARVTTGLGSGGVSFSHGIINASRSTLEKNPDALTKKVLVYGSSIRTMFAPPATDPKVIVSAANGPKKPGLVL